MPMVSARYRSGIRVCTDRGNLCSAVPWTDRRPLFCLGTSDERPDAYWWRDHVRDSGRCGTGRRKWQAARVADSRTYAVLHAHARPFRYDRLHAHTPSRHVSQNSRLGNYWLDCRGFGTGGDGLVGKFQYLLAGRGELDHARTVLLRVATHSAAAERQADGPAVVVHGRRVQVAGRLELPGVRSVLNPDLYSAGVLLRHDVDVP